MCSNYPEAVEICYSQIKASISTENFEELERHILKCMKPSNQLNSSALWPV